MCKISRLYLDERLEFFRINPLSPVDKMDWKLTRIRVSSRLHFATLDGEE